MLFVVFLEIGERKVDLALHLRAHHTLREHLVLHLVAVVLVRQAGLLLNPLLELLGILHVEPDLNLRHVLADVGIDVQVQILRLLQQQQLVDLVAQEIGRSLLDRLLQFVALQTAAPQFLNQLLAGLDEIATKHDIPIHLCDNLINQLHIRGQQH